MSAEETLRARLHHATSGVSLEVPRGWQVVDDVGAVTCEAPTARADVTGRAIPARLSIEMLERHGLVPPRALDVVVRDRVDDALAAHPHAWVLDCTPWDVRSPAGDPRVGAPRTASATGVRVDVALHDMTTPLVVTTVLVALEAGLLRVTASVPVAHQRSLGAEIDEALDSVLLGPVGAGLRATVAPGGAMLALPLPYASPSTWLTPEALEVFVTGSHKIAARWRPEPFAAGLVDDRGVATPLGAFVRRAVSRPDVRATLTVCPIELVQGAGQHQEVAASPVMVVDRLDGYAVLRASPPPVRATTPWTEQRHVSVEVVDLAAAPARAAAWLGLGPGRPAELPDGTLAVLGSVRSPAPGVRADGAASIVSALPGPREVWVRLLDALG